MAFGSLVGHMQTENGRATEGRRHWESMPPGEEPRAYKMAFPTSGGPGDWGTGRPGDWGTVLLRGFRDKRRQGCCCRYTFPTSIYEIPLSFWRRETSPAYGAPTATCWCPGVL